MQRQICLSDLPALCLGAAVLGSGGGGDTAILSSFVTAILKTSGSVNLIGVNELNDNDLVVPMAYIGSPAVSLAEGPTLALFVSLIESIKADYPNKNLILMPAEIGGCNALTPFVAASYLGLPLLDADLIGRAFPKVSMCKPAVYFPGQAQALYLANRVGEVLKTSAQNVFELETKARTFTVETGGSASIVTYLFKGLDYEKYVIEGSITRALTLGQDCLSKQGMGVLHGEGVVTKLTRVTQDGFLMGSVCLTTTAGDITIAFQNEYLSASINGQQCIKTPDLIVLLDQAIQVPVASESLALGQALALIALPAPDFWRDPLAAEAVSLNQFSFL